MTSKLYYNPFIPAFSGVGVPIANARTYFYYTATSIKAPIYVDAALTTVLANPVVSDLAGKYPRIYMDPAITYRVVQTDSNDSPLGDAVDPYIPGTGGLPGPPGDMGPPGINGGVGSSSGIAALFTAASGMIIGVGITQIETAGFRTQGKGGGNYVYDSSVDAAFVSANPLWSFLSADGRGWRLAPDGYSRVNLYQFGAYGDNTHNDYASVAAAQDCVLFYQSIPEFDVYYSAVPEISVPVGKFYMGGNTIVCKKATYSFRGVLNANIGTGASASCFRFDINTRGVQVDFINTSGDTTGSITSAGTGTVFENIKLEGGGGTDKTKCGIRIRATAHVYNCTVINFAGDGLNLTASVGGGGAEEGGANLCRVSYNTFRDNGRHGIFCDGADANAGIFIANNCMHNARWARYDSSFLGNTWISNHGAGNGIGTVGCTDGGINTYSSIITDASGNAYFCVVGQETAAATTAPGTNDAVWEYIPDFTGTSPVYPLWVSGTPCFAGGSECTDSLNSYALMIGSYSEIGDGPAQIKGSTLKVGGASGVSRSSEGAFIQSNSDLGAFANNGVAALSFNAVGTTQTSRYAKLGSPYSLSRLLTFYDSQVLPQSSMLKLVGSGGDIDWQYQNSPSNRAFGISGPSTALTFGQAASVPHAFYVDRLVVGGTNGRLFHVVDTLPTSGNVARGEVFFGLNPVAGQPPAATCTTGGVAGSTAVFKTFANLAA